VISIRQFARIARSQRRILPLLILIAAAWQSLYTFILSSSSLRELMEAYMTLMPPVFRRFLSLTGAGFSAQQFLAFGFTHPSMLFVLIFVPVAISSRFITGEIEGRSVEILALRIFPKRRLVGSAWLFTLFAHTLIFAGMMTGSMVTQQMSGLKDGLPWQDLWRIVLTGLLFFTAVNSMVTALATLFSARGRAMAWSIGFLLSAFIFDALVKVWEQADFLKPWSLFHWYQPVDVVNGKYDYGTAVILLSLLMVLPLIWALEHFEKRDI